MSLFGKGRNHGTWYTDWREHPGELVKDTEVFKPKDLTDLQKSGTVYEPIEAYMQKWKHETDKNGTMTNAYPVGEPQRADLPPLYIQWKQDWKRRFIPIFIGGK